MEYFKKQIIVLQKEYNLTGSFPETFNDGVYDLKRNNQLKDFLCSVFGKDCVRVAYDIGSRFSKGSWDMCGCNSVFVTKDWKVVGVSNSEWGGMDITGKLQVN